MIESEQLGSHGEQCGDCGHPLATDQRYCLNCGARRSGPRVEYRHYMALGQGATNDEPIGPEVGMPQTEEPAGRDYAPLAAVGGIAILGLMLLVGVLIGKGDGTASAPAPAPIVRVAEPDSGQAASDGGGAGGESAKAVRGGSGVDAKTVKGGLTGGAARQAEGTVQATTDDLESLEQATGDDYEDVVKKLPDKIATPGAPPPIDKSKAPGGGGAAETFE